MKNLKGKTRELKDAEISLIRKWSDEGIRQAEIASRLGIAQSTVCYQLKRTRSIANASSVSARGRKKCTSTATDSFIVNKAKENRFLSAPKIVNCVLNATGTIISKDTVYRRLSSNGIFARAPRKVPLISKLNREKRERACREWMKRGPAFWNSVIWSDETKLNYFKSDGMHYCWRMSGEAYSPDCTQKTVKYGGGCIMLWGCMAAGGLGNLVKIDGIMNSVQYLRILQENLVDSAEKLGLGANFVFQQDNDPKHSSRLLKEYFSGNALKVLEWPSQSPYHNVIEHLWAYVKKRYHESPSTTKSGMYSKIIEIWNNIPATVTRNLVNSVYRRFENVIAAKGGATRY